MVLGEFNTSKQQSSREKAHSSVRRPVASPAKSPSLAVEAAEMEAKLLELRKAMEQERAKREGKGADGSYWRSGAAAGQLRSGVRSKTGTPLPPVQQQAGNGESVTANIQRWTADMDARPVQPSISAAAAGRISAPTSRPDSGGQALSHRPGQLATPRHVLPRVDNPSQGHVARPFHDQPNDSSTGNLADGVFNEADSHGSFLDALNEWRAANRGDKQPEPSVSQQPQQQQLRPRPSLTQPSQQGQEASSMQTESRVTPRPGSAGKPVTYFNRLLLNSASRQAGHAASSSTTPALEGGGGPSSSSGLTRRSSHILPPLTSPSGSSSQLHSASQLHSQPHSSSQVYAVETAMTSPAQSMAGTASRHRGLDILEELEALERKQHSLMQQYDSDDEWAALLSPHGQAGRRKQQQEQLVVTTQQGLVGLTKGVRLPDAILLPEVDSDEDAGQ